MCSGNPRKSSCRKFRPTPIVNHNKYWGATWSVNKFDFILHIHHRCHPMRFELLIPKRPPKEGEEIYIKCWEWNPLAIGWRGLHTRGGSCGQKEGGHQHLFYCLSLYRCAFTFSSALRYACGYCGLLWAVDVSEEFYVLIMTFGRWSAENLKDGISICAKERGWFSHTKHQSCTANKKKYFFSFINNWQPSQPLF